MWYDACMEIRGQLSGVSSVLPTWWGRVSLAVSIALSGYAKVSGRFSVQAHISTEPSCYPTRRPVISRADETKSQEELKKKKKQERTQQSCYIYKEELVCMNKDYGWHLVLSLPPSPSSFLTIKASACFPRTRQEERLHGKDSRFPTHNFKSCMSQGDCYGEWWSNQSLSCYLIRLTAWLQISPKQFVVSLFFENWNIFHGERSSWYTQEIQKIQQDLSQD